MPGNNMLILSIRAFVFILTLAGVASAEADGFRGLKWGTEFSAIEGEMTYSRTDSSYGGVKMYKRKGDGLTIGGAELKSIEYGFWRNRLCSVMITLEGSGNFSSLKDAVFLKFGEGRKPNQFMEEYLWGGEVTGMTLEYSVVTNQGHLFMFSSEICREQKKFEEDRAGKGGGAESGF
jgi:hypothetical protein